MGERCVFIANYKPIGKDMALYTDFVRKENNKIVNIESIYKASKDYHDKYAHLEPIWMHANVAPWNQQFYYSGGLGGRTFTVKMDAIMYVDVASGGAGKPHGMCLPYFSVQRNNQIQFSSNGGDVCRCSGIFLARKGDIISVNAAASNTGNPGAQGYTADIRSLGDKECIVREMNSAGDWVNVNVNIDNEDASKRGGIVWKNYWGGQPIRHIGVWALYEKRFNYDHYEYVVGKKMFEKSLPY